MALTLTREQLQCVDRLAVERLAIPSIVLMENAARGAAEVIHAARPDGPIAIVCGGGNNGGDGYAVARHLCRLGRAVTLHAVKPPDELAGDAAINCRICRHLGLPIREGDAPLAESVVVDAVLGTGFAGGPVRADAAAAIRRINAARDGGATVVALDVPSGLDCDRGEPADPTVVADLTVTFQAEKIGFAAAAARAHVGRLVVGDIGLPEAWVRRVLDL